MTLLYEPLDCDGREIQPGDLVQLLQAPAELIDGLPEEDVMAICAQVGKMLRIEEFDQYGHAVLMFRDSQDMIHFISLAPKYLRFQSK